MEKHFNYFLIASICLLLNSCGGDSPFFEVDNTAPVIAEVTAVTTPTNDNTPNYTFSSTESGSIYFEGSCSSSITSVIAGTNTITFSSLSDGTYSDCKIIITDSLGNSVTMNISSFTVSTTPANITATGAAGQVSLNWSAVSGVNSYIVYWDNSTGVSSSSTAITSISSDNYTHSGIDNGTIYYYKVAAVFSDNTTGPLSSEVSAHYSSSCTRQFICQWSK